MKQHPQRHDIALAHARRRDEFVEVHFVVVLIPKGHHVDLHTGGLGVFRFHQNVAHVVVAIGHQDDALGAIGREHRQRQSNRGSHIRPITMIHLRKSAHRNVVSTEHRKLLKVCIGCKIDHTDAVVGIVFDLLADGCEVLLLDFLQILNAVGTIHQEKNGELVGRTNVHHVGKAKRQRKDDQTSNRNHQHTSRRLNRDQHPPRYNGQDRDQQQQPQPCRSIHRQGQDQCQPVLAEPFASHRSYFSKI